MPPAGIFPTQRSNPRLLHLLPWHSGSSPLHHVGSLCVNPPDPRCRHSPEGPALPPTGSPLPPPCFSPPPSPSHVRPGACGTGPHPSHSAWRRRHSALALSLCSRLLRRGAVSIAHCSIRACIISQQTLKPLCVQFTFAMSLFCHFSLIFGCAGPSLLHAGFLSLQRAGGPL